MSAKSITVDILKLLEKKKKIVFRKREGNDHHPNPFNDDLDQKIPKKKKTKREQNAIKKDIFHYFIAHILCFPFRISTLPTNLHLDIPISCEVVDHNIPIQFGFIYVQ